MDFFSFVKPKNDLETTSGKQDNVPFIPEEMWMKCPKCNTLLLTTDMEENLNVCTTCNHHFRMNAKRRVELFADPETFEEHDTELKSSNILGFPGYDKKLEKAKDKGNESVTCGTCKIDGTETVLCVMNAEFMMGSMGTVTGEKITFVTYADGKNLRRGKTPQRRGTFVYNSAHRPHNGRRNRFVCNGGRYNSCRARLSGRVCRSARN